MVSSKQIYNLCFLLFCSFTGSPIGPVSPLWPFSPWRKIIFCFWINYFGTEISCILNSLTRSPFRPSNPLSPGGPPWPGVPGGPGGPITCNSKHKDINKWINRLGNWLTHVFNVCRHWMWMLCMWCIGHTFVLSSSHFTILLGKITFLQGQDY